MAPTLVWPSQTWWATWKWRGWHVPLWRMATSSPNSKASFILPLLNMSASNVSAHITLALTLLNISTRWQFRVNSFCLCWGALVAKLVEWTPHIQRLCPHWSDSGFDSTLWPFVACHSLSLFPFSCQLLSFPVKNKDTKSPQKYLYKKSFCLSFCINSIKEMKKVLDTMIIITNMVTVDKIVIMNLLRKRQQRKQCYRQRRSVRPLKDIATCGCRICFRVFFVSHSSSFFFGHVSL